MFIYRAVLLHVFFLAVAVDAEPIHLQDEQVPTVCSSDWRQAICQFCGSIELDDRCCWEDATYGRCIDRLGVYPGWAAAAERNGAETWAREGSSSSSFQNSEKRAKYFLGKRVKYFLGKRQGGGARGRQQQQQQLDADASLEEENDGAPFRLGGVDADKRAKYFLGK